MKTKSELKIDATACGNEKRMQRLEGIFTWEGQKEFWTHRESWLYTWATIGIAWTVFMVGLGIWRVIQ